MIRFKQSMGALMLALVTPVLIAPTLAAPAPDSAPSYRQQISAGDAVQKLSAWPAGPRLAGFETIAKYGAPNEITDERMIWHNAMPFKRILLTREVLPHHFPIVHMDYLEHTISYTVPADKAGQVLAFDGALSIYRVGGELSARCDLESNNILALNLAHDIVEGRKSVEQARQAFGDAMIARTNGESPAIAKELQFNPHAPMGVANTDTVSIPGAPRPADAYGSASPDAETLALLVALNLDKVHAAMIAQNKTGTEPIQGYVRMMHESHARHLAATVNVGGSSNVTPVTTSSVSALKERSAAALAEIVLLEGAAFSRAYMDFEINAHTEAQNMVDERLAITSNEAVRNHLNETRNGLTMHLEQARRVQRDLGRRAPL